MRAQLQINGYNFGIDSVDPELLGKWFVEIFARVGPLDQSTYVTFQAWPSFGRDVGADTAMDWIADTRFNYPLTGFLTPRQLVEGLVKQLDDIEAGRM